MRSDDEVLALAERQYGAVANRQARELGSDRHRTLRRIRSGRWEQATSKVLRIVGSPATAEQALMIRVLHAGPTALASHESAAWLWQLPGFADHGVVLRRRQNHGDRVDQGHRPTLVLPHHRTEVRGIPCTTLPRTIFDLAAILHAARIARLVDTVVTRSPAMLPALHRTLPELAKRGRTGITTMREILAARPVGVAVPASGNERRFEALLHNAGIRGFERQVDVGGHSWLGRVDHLHRATLTIFEIDSELHHSSLSDRSRDAERDAAMVRAGYRKVVRIAAEDLWRDPFRVVSVVRMEIAAAA